MRHKKFIILHQQTIPANGRVNIKFVSNRVYKQSGKTLVIRFVVALQRTHIIKSAEAQL